MSRTSIVGLLILSTFLTGFGAGRVFSEPLSETKIKSAIDRGLKYLVKIQQKDGSWPNSTAVAINVGLAGLCVLALLHGGMSAEDVAVQRGLKFLRAHAKAYLANDVNGVFGQFETYQVSILIMAFVAGRHHEDVYLVKELAARLEGGQSKGGVLGAWTYTFSTGLKDGVGDPKTVPLFGVEFGCRTSIIYSPEDLGCLWEYWQKQIPSERNPLLTAKIERATQIGTNVIAYFTGREPPDKTQIRGILIDRDDAQPIEKDRLNVAKIRHDGSWNAVPDAMRNLLRSLNDNTGLRVSTAQKAVSLMDESLAQFPIVYLHGRNHFAFSPAELKRLKAHLEGGGTLFADACCGAKQFDDAFRELIGKLFPGKQLERIPTTAELFSEKNGSDIKLLSRRTSEGSDIAVGANLHVVVTEPQLEGFQLKGRYAVIYSKYDLSCALTGKDSGNCDGYLP